MKIYLDTNQLYYIRRIADEAQGSEYGNYSWAYRYFKNSPEMSTDIRALCYIIALQYEWDLEFSASDASYTELCQSLGDRTLRTRETWELFVATQTDETLNQLSTRQLPHARDVAVQGKLFAFGSLPDKIDFITDVADREIVRDFIASKADVCLTTDHDILDHKSELAAFGIKVIRPAEWLNDYLQKVRGEEDGADWVERILFRVR